MAPEKQNRKDIEVVKSFNGGSIRIEREWDFEADRAVEFVNVRGVRLQRRNPEHDGLPGFKGDETMFADMTFNSLEADFLATALMRYRIGHHTLFLGEPGFGKSRTLKFMAYLLNIPYHTVKCVAGMNVQKSFLFTGRKVDGDWEGVLGPLPRSMLDGGLLFIDELPNLPPEDRQVVLEPTERSNHPEFGRNDPPTLTLNDFPGEQTEFVAQPGWFIVAAGNLAEGQGANEISSTTDRETRRVRPHMLPRLPFGVGASRAAGRHLADKSNMRESLPGDPHLGLPTPTYYEKIDIQDNLIDLMPVFFEHVQAALKHEVLSTVKQNPPVFFTELFDRAFDHFMAFQVKKGDHEDGAASPEVRLQEIIESAVAALEFYFVNQFRENTHMKAPTLDLLTKTGLDQNPQAVASFKKLICPSGDDSTVLERVTVRDYIQWRIGTLVDQIFWKKEGEPVGKSIKARVSELLGVDAPPQLTPEEIARQRELTERLRSSHGAFMGNVKKIDDINKPASAHELSPENAYWVRNVLATDYGSSLTVTKNFIQGLPSAVIPELHAVTYSVLKNLNNADVEFLKTMRRPILHIVPVRPSHHYIDALNSDAFVAVQAGVVDPHFNPKGLPQAKAKVDSGFTNAAGATNAKWGLNVGGVFTGEYRFIIAEGDYYNVKTILDPTDYDGSWNSDDDISMNERVKEFKAATTGTNIVSLNSIGGVFAAARGLAEEEPISVDKTTLLFDDVDAAGNPVDPMTLTWNSGQFDDTDTTVYVSFDEAMPGNQQYRICACVMGKIETPPDDSTGSKPGKAGPPPLA